MQLSQNDRSALAGALEALDRGQTDAFDDALWICFGDRWWSVRTQLSKEGFIRLRGSGDGVPESTERGLRLARRLVGRDRATPVGSTQG